MESVGLEYEIMANDRKLLEALRRSGQAIGQFSREAEREAEGLDSVFGKLAKTVGGIFAFGQMKNFVQQVVAVRSEFQNTEASFKVFLGSAEKASGFMKEIQSYAFNNVFEFKDLTKQAAQLLAFQHDVKDTIPILDKLSNVAAGVNIPLGNLVDLYNKAKSKDKLNLIDVQQWSVMGDVITDMADMLGKSKEEIREMVSEGKVGFNEIDALINKMTESGGRFHGMMGEKMKTLGDSVGLLQDSISAMMNEIGEKSQGVLRGGILAVNELVENYEKVGKVILGLIATYGAYKTAVVAVTIAQNIAAQSAKGYTLAMQLQYKWALLAEKAQSILNKTMLANPYVAVTMIVVGLVAAVWALRDAATAEEKAQRRLNDELERQKESRDKAASNANTYYNTIKDGTQTVYAQLNALKKLKEEFPKVFGEMGLEDMRKMTYEDFNKLTNTWKVDDKLEKEIKIYEDAASRVAKIKEELYDENGKIKVVSSDRRTTLTNALRLANIDMEAALSNLNKLKADMREAEIEGLGKDEKIAYYDKEIEKLQEQQREVQKLIDASGEAADAWSTDVFSTIAHKAKLDALQKTIDKILGKKEELNGGDDSTTVGEYINDLRKKIKTVETEYKRLTSLGATYDKNAIEEQETLLTSLKAEFKKLTGTDWDKKDNTEKQRDYSAQLEREERDSARRSIDLAHAVEQARIDALDDGFEKRMAQNELNFEKEKERLNRQEKDMLAQLQEWEKTKWLATNQGKTDDDWLKSEKKKSVALSQEQLEMLEKQRKYAQKVYDATTRDIIESEKEKYNQLLLDYGDYEQRKRAIAEKWEKEIARLPIELQAEAKKRRDKEIAELDAQFIEKSDLWRNLFGDMEEITLKEARSIADELRKMVLQIADPEVKQKLLDMLNEVSRKVEENASAIERMFGNSRGAGIANLFFGEGNIENKLKAFSTTFKGAEKSSANIAQNASSAASSMGKAGSGAAATLAIIDAIIKGIHGLIQGMRDVAIYFREYQESVNGEVSKKMQRLSDNIEVLGKFDEKVFSGWEKLKSGDLIGAITDNIQAWHELFTTGKRKQAEYEKQAEESLERQYFGQFEINQLYRERYEWAKKIGETELTYIQRKGEELGHQLAGNEKDQNALWKDLMGKGQYKTAEAYVEKNTGFLSLGHKTHDAQWASLAGKTWEEIELLAAQGLLSEEGMKFYEALKKAKDEGEDLAKRQEEFLEYTKELFTGTTWDGVTNSIVEGFKAGKRSAADFADTFEQLMQGAMASALQMAADEKTKKFYEEFADRADDADGLTQADIDYLNDMWNGIIENLSQKTAELEQVTSRQLGDGGNKSLSGSIKSLTEETGSTIAGQVNAMRVYLADMLSAQSDIALLQRRQTDIQVNLVAHAQMSVLVLQNSLVYHRETAQNTAVLHEINNRLEAMADRQSLPETDPYKVKY